MRSTRIVISLTAVAAATALVGACSSNTPGSAGPTTGPTDQGSPSAAPTTASSSGSGNLHGAPPVTAQIDTTKYQQNPCSALTSAQQQSLGFNQQGQSFPTKNGPSCLWNIGSGAYAVTFIQFPDPNQTNYPTHGLPYYYRVKATNISRLPDVDGQPAVKLTSDVTGQCAVVVGATNDFAFDGDVTLSPGNVGYSDPCGEALKIATAATQTMKSGG